MEIKLSFIPEIPIEVVHIVSDGIQNNFYH